MYNEPDNTGTYCDQTYFDQSRLARKELDGKKEWL